MRRAHKPANLEVKVHIIRMRRIESPRQLLITRDLWILLESKMIRGGMTRAQEERVRAVNRRREYEREDNKRLVAREKLMRANVAADERVENKRFVRRLQQEKMESEMEERILESERQRVLKQKQAEQEEKLANVRAHGLAGVLVKK